MVYVSCLEELLINNRTCFSQGKRKESRYYIFGSIPMGRMANVDKITASGVLQRDCACMGGIYKYYTIRMFDSCRLQGILWKGCNTVIWRWWEELMLVGNLRLWNILLLFVRWTGWVMLLRAICVRFMCYTLLEQYYTTGAAVVPSHLLVGCKPRPRMEDFDCRE